jgi:hypothetical protein
VPSHRLVICLALVHWLQGILGILTLDILYRYEYPESIFPELVFTDKKLFVKSNKKYIYFEFYIFQAFPNFLPNKLEIPHFPAKKK